MYLASGMFFESVRTLITNELQVPTLHSLDPKDGLILGVHIVYVGYMIVI